MPEILKYRSALCMKLFGFVSCGEFCDAKILVKDACFDCHKVILAAASPLLRNIMKNEPAKNDGLVLRMDFLPTKVVEFLLRYFYTGDVIDEFVHNSALARAIEIFCDADSTASTLDQVEEVFLSRKNNWMELSQEYEDIFEITKSEDFELSHEFEDFGEEEGHAVTQHNKNDSMVMYSIEVMQDPEDQSMCDKKASKTMCAIKHEKSGKSEPFPKYNVSSEFGEVNFKELQSGRVHLVQNGEHQKLNFVIKVDDFNYYNFPQRPRANLPRKPPFLCPCENCGKIFESYEKLRSHYRHTHGEKRFKCSLCPLRFLYPKDLKCHMRTHTGEKPFICEICGRGFAQMGSMTIHMRTHKKKREKPKVIVYPCAECKKQFCRKEKQISNAEHYDLSIEGLSSLICPNSNCAKKFSSTKALRKHLRNDVCNQGKLFCVSCNTEYESIVLLHRHIGKMHCTHKRRQRRIKVENSTELDGENNSAEETLVGEIDGSVIETTVPVDALGLDHTDDLLEFCGEVVMEGLEE